MIVHLKKSYAGHQLKAKISEIEGVSHLVIYSRFYSYRVDDSMDANNKELILQKSHELVEFLNNNFLYIDEIYDILYTFRDIDINLQNLLESVVSHITFNCESDEYIVEDSEHSFFDDKFYGELQTLF